MSPNLQETSDLVTFTEEIFNGKSQFFCSVGRGPSQYVRRGHSLALQRKPYGYVYSTSFRDVAMTSSRRNFARSAVYIRT